MHTDLLANGVIEDPFRRDNELRLQWIEEEDWHYRTVFRLPPAMQRAEHPELVFEGLDTYAEVRLNDVEILRANNMFRRWEADVSEIVRQGENRLDLVFRSPVATALPPPSRPTDFRSRYTTNRRVRSLARSPTTTAGTGARDS